MTERYPVTSATPDGPEHLVVELPVLSVRWLERLLLRLGPGAEVLEPAELRRAGAEAAARVLARLPLSGLAKAAGAGPGRGAVRAEVVGEELGASSLMPASWPEAGEEHRRGLGVGGGVVGPVRGMS